MNPIANAMRLQALRAGASKVVSRYGIVTGYDPNKYAAKVTLQPEGFDTGFIPIAAVWAGHNWGFFAPPVIGSQVAVVFIEGELTAGYIESTAFNSTNTPLPVPAGELWIVHKTGAFVKFTNDGKLTLSDNNGAQIVLDGAGNIASTGSWTHSGTAHFLSNVQVDATLTASTDVIGGGKSLKNHDHNVIGIQAGGSTIATTPPI